MYSVIIGSEARRRFAYCTGQLSGSVKATAALMLYWSCPANARPDAATISDSPNIGAHYEI